MKRRARALALLAFGVGFVRCSAHRTGPGGADGGCSDVTCADAGAGPTDAGPPCLRLASFDAGSQIGFYSPDAGGYAITMAISKDATAFSQLVNEVFWNGNTVQLPANRDWSQAASLGLSKCDWCVFINEGCSPTTGVCSNQLLLAVGGTGSLTRADRDAGGGAFVASATSLHLVAWKYEPATGADEAVAGGACLDIDQMTVSVTWGSDGGAPDGGADGGDGG